MSDFSQKFETLVPGKNEAGEEWVDVESARHPCGANRSMKMDGATSSLVDRSKAPFVGNRSIPNANALDAKFNCLPPGQTIDNNCGLNPTWTHGMAGETDVSDDVGESVEKGYKRVEMNPWDDTYTGEHADPFYVDVGGFIERNNNLDRY